MIRGDRATVAIGTDEIWILGYEFYIPIIAVNEADPVSGQSGRTPTGPMTRGGIAQELRARDTVAGWEYTAAWSSGPRLAAPVPPAASTLRSPC